MKSIVTKLIAMIAVLTIFGPAAIAGDLSYTTLVPQTGDNAIEIDHKAQLTLAPSKVSNIAATGTTTLTSVAKLDRIVVGKAGTSDSQLVITDGTNALATVTTATQAALPFNVVITTGTLKLVNTGTTSAVVTVGYR